MAKNTHHYSSTLKKFLFLFVILVLPLAVFYASNSKLNDSRSSAFVYEDEGMGSGSSSPSLQDPSAKYSFYIRIPRYSPNGDIVFMWDRVSGATHYSLVGTYGENAPLKNYYTIGNTSSLKLYYKSSKVFNRGKGKYYFGVIAYMKDGSTKSSNLASITRK